MDSIEKQQTQLTERILKSLETQPLIDVIRDIVFEVNKGPEGLGSRIVDGYDGKKLVFKAFDKIFVYFLEITDSKKNPNYKYKCWPCAPVWGISCDVFALDEVCKSFDICNVGLSKSNSTEPFLEIIAAHLYSVLIDDVMKAKDPLK